MIFKFSQNNSGGYYSKPAKNIIVTDVRDEKHAIEIALKAGMYFDGVADGDDCSCCGDRWYPMPNKYDHINEAIADSSFSLCDGDGIPQYVIVDSSGDSEDSMALRGRGL